MPAVPWYTGFFKQNNAAREKVVAYLESQPDNPTFHPRVPEPEVVMQEGEIAVMQIEYLGTRHYVKCVNGQKQTLCGSLRNRLLGWKRSYEGAEVNCLRCRRVYKANNKKE